jgi:hypothetical protein
MKKLLTVLAMAAMPLVASAQFPAKPIRMVVPFPGGSATDTVARILANSVTQSIGQTIVVENKAGADGAIAGAEVAKAPPDGYTVLMATNSPMSAVPAMKKSPPYDPIADFSPITDVGRYTFFLYIHPSVPAKTFQDLIAYAKANPNKLNYATGNTTGIVSFAQMNALAGRGHRRPRRRPCAAHVRHADDRSRPGQGRQAASPGYDALETQRPPSGGAHHRGGRHAAVLDHFLGGALRPGKNAARGARAPEPRVRRRHGAAGSPGGDGQAGLRPDPVLARSASAVREGAA